MSNEEQKARAFAYYNADDPSRWGREDIAGLKEEIARWIQSTTTPDRIILELGCGKGALRDCHPHYVGVDISLPVLKRFLRGAAAVQADIEQLRFRDNSARVAFSIATLEHVPNPERVLEETHRVLKPSGIAIWAPAWFCRPWAASGLPAKRYRELNWIDRIRRATILIRNNLVFRAAHVIPQRLGREIRFALEGGQLKFEYKRLSPNLRDYVYTDCDAFTSMDPHALITYFRGRGYEIMGISNFWNRVFIRSGPVVVRKPLQHCGAA